MMSKTVSIGPFQLGMLEGLRIFANIDTVLDFFPRIDATAICYSSLMQSGAKKFELAFIEQKFLPSSEFLRRRISIFPKEDYQDLMTTVGDVFSRFVPIDYRERAEYSGVIDFEWFLIDLGFALKRGTSLLRMLGPPDLSRLKGKVPPEVYFAARNLLNAIENDQARVPVPKASLEGDEIRLFFELVASQQFDEYSLSHCKLDCSDVPKTIALGEIEQKAAIMFEKSSRLIELKRRAVSILPITSEIVESIFGKLPGALAEHFVRLITTFLNDKRRVVIYNGKDLFQELVVNRIREATRKSTQQK